jgi:hypothetical protein
MMKRLLISVTLTTLLLGIFQTPAKAGTGQDGPIEIVEIKDLGLSDRDESRSVIEVRWRVDQGATETSVSFDLVLFITYADGTTIRANRKITGNGTSARFEVPSVRSAGGGTPAFIKRMEARVAAVISKT